MSIFYIKGLGFERLDNGDVKIYAIDEKGDGNLLLQIPPKEWASVVASVSRGGDSLNWGPALELHMALPSGA